MIFDLYIPFPVPIHLLVLLELERNRSNRSRPIESCLHQPHSGYALSCYFCQSCFVDIFVDSNKQQFLRNENLMGNDCVKSVGKIIFFTRIIHGYLRGVA